MVLPSLRETTQLGHELAATMPERAIVYLRGDLGAGKSALARAWLQALGVTGSVKSPTYTLVEQYPIAAGQAAHLDLYRIAESAELDFLGLDELADSARLWLVEWPDRGAGTIPAADLEIELLVEGEGRRARIDGGGLLGAAWLDRFSKTGLLRGSV